MRKGFFDRPVKKATPTASTAPKPATPASSASTTTTTPASSDTTSHLPIPPIKLPPSVIFPTQPVHPDVPFWSFLTPDSTREKPNAECALHLVPAGMKAALDRSSFIRTGGKAPLPKLPSNLTDRENYEIRDIPGKGKGLIALRPLPQDTIVLIDRPFLVYEPDRIPRPHLNPVLTHALSHLSFARQHNFMNLSTAFAGPTAAIQGRVETNEFPCVTFPGEDVSYSGVFPVLSRVNHACDANAMIEWDADEFVVVLKTTRMVRIGEEICFCYIVPFQKRAQRQQELMLKWRFECKCNWCSLSDEESAEKDKEREHMAELFMKEMQAMAPTL